MSKYLPSERRAILVHRYFLGIEWGRDPGLDATIRSWEDRIAPPWREKKMRADRIAQMSEIDRHRTELSESRGIEIGWEEAIADWARHHAADWRQHWEASPAAGA
jgi:hypothetical protein